MKETVLSILTNPEARNESAVSESLGHEFTAGAPWFD